MEDTGVRRILLVTAALCFVSGSVCFAVFFVGVLRFVVDLPSVEEGLSRAATLQTWTWWFVGFYALGFAILWFVPDRSEDTVPSRSGAVDNDRVGPFSE